MIQNCGRQDDHTAHRTEFDICAGIPENTASHLEHRSRHGVGFSDDTMGNLHHLLAPIIGHMRMDLHNGVTPDEKWLTYAEDRLSLALKFIRDEVDKR